jgi:DNA-binding NarL/FixJ family response regulator
VIPAECPPAGYQGPAIGRDAELEIVWGRFTDAVAGASSVVLVCGEPGVGKTRLLQQAASRAAATGARVLCGGASEAEGMPPYLPFLEALGEYLREAPPEQLREHAPGMRAAILASIFPEIAERLGELPPGPPLPPEQARLRLYEAVGAFLLSLSQASPLLVVLDDLQWADPASLDLLCHVMRRRASARVLILGAYRAGEPERYPVLDRTISELNRLRALTQITVGPLPKQAVAELAARQLGAPASARLTELLHSQSEGNPFFAEELLRGWLETRALATDGLEWDLAAGPPNKLPPGIVSAVRQRLARLSPDVVDQLRVAAILGRAFEPALLAAVAGEDAELVEGRLMEACRAGLVRADDGGGYAFTHDKIRESLYAEVSSARRARLHEAIGRELEKHVDHGGPQQLAALAFHFSHSPNRERGVVYLERAAERALATYAVAEAVSHLSAALRLLDPGDGRRGALLLRLGEAAMLADALREAIDAYGEAREWWSREGDRVNAARAAHGEGLARWRLEELGVVRSSFETALELLGDSALPETVRVLVDMATLLGVDLLQQAEGLTYGRRAVELARRLGEKQLEGAATRVVGYLLVTASDQLAGARMIERALTLAEQGNHLADAAECCAYLANVHYWQARIGRAREVTERRQEFAARGHAIYHTQYSHSYLAFLHVHRGEWAEAAALLARPEPEQGQLAGPLPGAFLLQIRALQAYQRAEYEAAEALLHQAIAALRHTGSGVLLWMQGLLGATQAALGEHDAARALVPELEGMISVVPPGTLAIGAGLNCLALTAMALGDEAAAAGYRAQLLEYEGLHLYFLVDRVLGALEVGLGEWSAAEEHLERAEATARREALRPELARVLVARAELALARGGAGSATHARNLLGQARGVWLELGTEAEAERVRERLRGLPSQPGQPADAATPAGLSARELEVLRLVAAGKSNRQIAMELYLSEKTVANHLTSIFNKTNTDNRTAATAFALRHSLA